MKELIKYIKILELDSFEYITKEILKKKYRQLAMKYHPDITGKNTNQEMAELNNSYDYVYNNIDLTNKYLRKTWTEKQVKFEKIYQETKIRNFNTVTIQELKHAIERLNTILGYKDVNDIIIRYEKELNTLLRQEEENKKLYDKTKINIDHASVEQITEAINIFKTINSYKDVKQLIKKYEEKLEEIKLQEFEDFKFYNEIKKNKNQSYTNVQLTEIINFLSRYKFEDSKELLDYYLSRVDQLTAVNKIIENDKTEKKYLKLIEDYENSTSIDEYKSILINFKDIENYKDTTELFNEIRAKIDGLRIENENKYKEDIYINATHLFKENENLNKIKQAISLFEKIKGYKDVDELLKLSFEYIIDMEENKRLEKIYLDAVKNYSSNNVFTLEKHLISLVELGSYSNAKQLVDKYNVKINEIKLINQETYENGILKDGEEITIKLLKYKISQLEKIINYKDSKEILKQYKSYLKELREQKAQKYRIGLVKRVRNIYMPIFSVLVVFLLVNYLVIIPKATLKKYNESIVLFNERNYDKAEVFFNENYDYKDSKHFITAIQAISELENDRFDAMDELPAYMVSNKKIIYDNSFNSYLLNQKYQPKDYNIKNWILKSYNIIYVDGKFDIFVEIEPKVWELKNYNVVLRDGDKVVSNNQIDIYSTIRNQSITKPNHIFLGWYEKDKLNPYNFESKITNDLELHAQWVKFEDDYIYLGEYPQTVVSDQNLIWSLNRIYETDANGYYEYEGEKYAKLDANPLSHRYNFSNGDRIEKKTYYFKVEPIKWFILKQSNGTYTLLADLILDKEQYHTSLDDRIINDEIIYANNYEHSAIRYFLNNTFYNKAFEPHHKNIILTSLVDNSASTTSHENNMYASNNTNDKVFLLSYQEANNIYFTNDTDRKAMQTDYSKAKYTHIEGDYEEWTIRSPFAFNFDNNYFVSHGGSTTFNLTVQSNKGVRPVINIKFD